MFERTFSLNTVIRNKRYRMLAIDTTLFNDKFELFVHFTAESPEILI